MGGSGVQDYRSLHREAILGYLRVYLKERDKGRERRGFTFPNQHCSVEKNSPSSLPFTDYKINVFLNKELLSNHLLGAYLGGPGPPCPASNFKSPRKPLQSHNPHRFFLSIFCCSMVSFSLRHSLVRYVLYYRNHPFPEVTPETR